ncbi:MAG: class I SAM-dependent methyltransferase [Candidatus Stahlbacteria bacterium]|nr:MAG: class I SAM-dependent methyltransferase [Candidatus Stahlbacteria bacterium]
MIVGYEEKRKYAKKGGKFVPCPFAAHRMCLGLIDGGETVLDVGCATGYLSFELKEKGCKVIGLEIDPEMAEEARLYCDKVILGNAEVIELPYKEYFDVILYADVLEHLRNPLEVLIRFKSCLKQNGYIVVSIPNVANWFIRLSLLFGKFNYNSKKGGILDSGHLRFFTLRTVREMLEKAGFKIVHLDITVDLPGLSRFPFMRTLVKLWKKLFAVQFIIKAIKYN